MIREAVMSGVVQRAVRAAIVLAVMLLVLSPAVSAHSGEGVAIDHVIIEIATWALAVTAVIAAIVGVFWVRARVSRR